MNWKIPFRIICWIQEWYRTIRTGVNVSGHDYIAVYTDETEDILSHLKCEICGKISK